MKGIDLKAFRKANSLTQDKLGEYLGVKKSFISQVESGRSSLPQEKFIKLLNNPFGWDVSMLKDNTLSGLDSVRPQREITLELIRSAAEMALSPDEKFLIGYLERKIENQDTLIRELYQKIGMLEAKLELTRKGEIASVVGGSSDADAV